MPVLQYDWPVSTARLVWPHLLCKAHTLTLPTDGEQMTNDVKYYEVMNSQSDGLTHKTATTAKATKCQQQKQNGRQPR